MAEKKPYQKKRKYPHLASNLKFLRKLYGETHADVCRALDIEEKTYQSYIQEDATPPPNILEKFAKHYRQTKDMLCDSKLSKESDLPLL